MTGTDHDYRELWEAQADAVIRDVVETAIRIYGSKRGLYRATEMIGVSERWLRAWRYGEPTRITKATYDRATVAVEQLRMERHAQLLAEMREIEAATNAKPAAHTVDRRRLDRGPMVGPVVVAAQGR